MGTLTLVFWVAWPIAKNYYSILMFAPWNCFFTTTLGWETLPWSQGGSWWQSRMQKSPSWRRDHHDQWLEDPEYQTTGSCCKLVQSCWELCNFERWQEKYLSLLMIGILGTQDAQIGNIWILSSPTQWSNILFIII